MSALVETRATVGSLIDRREIDNLPTLGRDFAELAKLAPGVTSTGQAAMGFSASGQRQFQNNVFVDGATNAMQFYGTQSESYPQDWVQEFQVMTNGFSAEFGQATGAVLNVITKQRHQHACRGAPMGSCATTTSTRRPTRAASSNGEPEFLSEPPQFNQQRFGGFLGGPISKDKLFFFGGYEDFENDATTVLAISDYWRNRGVAGRDSVEEHHAGAPAEGRLERERPQPLLAATQPDDEGGPELQRPGRRWLQQQPAVDARRSAPRSTVRSGACWAPGRAR